MAVTQLHRWIIDWLLHNSMPHCKKSRLEISQASLFLYLLKTRLKFQSTLKEQYDTQWAVNHKIMLLSELRLQLQLTLGWKKLWHHVHFTHLMTQSFPLFAAAKDSLCPPPMSSGDVGCSQLLLRYSVYFSLWCLFLALASERRGPAATCFKSLHIL